MAWRRKSRFINVRTNSKAVLAISGSQLHHNPERCQIYFPIGHHLLKPRLGSIARLGIWIQSSTVTTRSICHFFSQILTVDNPMDSPHTHPSGRDLRYLLCYLSLACILHLSLCAVCNIVLCWTVLSRDLVVSYNTVTADAHWDREKKIATILQTPWISTALPLVNTLESMNLPVVLSQLRDE